MSSGIYFHFSSCHEEMPNDCDQFGYLNLSKAFDEHKVFTAHANRPYLDDLLDTLRKSNLDEREFSWMVTPHAYYVLPHTNKVINMYSPGTSFVLHLIPIEYRKRMFPVLAIFFLLLFSIIALYRANNNTFGWADIILLLFAFYITEIVPFRAEFERINSLSITFGLLLAAGILLRNKPLLSCFLIALSANFRYANLLLLLPIILFIPLPKVISVKKVFDIIKIGITYFVVTLIAILPHLIYTYFLLGNPFKSTYAAIDTAMSMDVLKNLNFYFNYSQPWFIFHLLLVGVIAYFAYIQKTTWRFVLSLLAFPVINYLFFIFKMVSMNYYPYGSAFILLGAILYILKDVNVSLQQAKRIQIACVFISFLTFSFGIISYSSKNHQSFIEAKNEVKGLCSYDIIWGDSYPGTSEYVCTNNGFRYTWSTMNARIIAMKFLHNRKYSQAFILDEIPVDEKIIESEIQSCNLLYHKIRDPHLGNILIIDK